MVMINKMEKNKGGNTWSMRQGVGMWGLNQAGNWGVSIPGGSNSKCKVLGKAGMSKQKHCCCTGVSKGRK